MLCPSCPPSPQRLPLRSPHEWAAGRHEASPQSTAPTKLLSSKNLLSARSTPVSRPLTRRSLAHTNCYRSHQGWSKPGTGFHSAPGARHRVSNSQPKHFSRKKAELCNNPTHDLYKSTCEANGPIFFFSVISSSRTNGLMPKEQSLYCFKSSPSCTGNRVPT